MAAGDLDSTVASAETVRITAGLLRVALDRAELVVRGDGDPAPITRMRRRSGDRAVLVATDPSLFDLAPRLGEIADSLVAELSESSSVVPASYATARIREAWPRVSRLVVGYIPLNGQAAARNWPSSPVASDPRRRTAAATRPGVRLSSTRRDSARHDPTQGAGTGIDRPEVPHRSTGMA
jgi:hypothetical protein